MLFYCIQNRLTLVEAAFSEHLRTPLRNLWSRLVPRELLFLATLFVFGSACTKFAQYTDSNLLGMGIVQRLSGIYGCSSANLCPAVKGSTACWGCLIFRV